MRFASLPRQSTYTSLVVVREKLARPRRGYTDCVVELRIRAWEASRGSGVSDNGIVISGLPANLAKYLARLPAAPAHVSKTTPGVVLD